MKKWKIDFLEICNFSKKMKKRSARKIQKNKKWGAHAKRAPPIFWIFVICRSFSFFIFLEKLQISRKSIFHFFIFSIFWKFVHFIDFRRFSTKWLSHWEDGLLKSWCPSYFHRVLDAFWCDFPSQPGIPSPPIKNISMSRCLPMWDHISKICEWCSNPSSAFRPSK